MVSGHDRMMFSMTSHNLIGLLPYYRIFKKVSLRNLQALFIAKVFTYTKL